MLYFKSLPQLLKHFTDDTVCMQFLEQKLWKGEPFCPHCGSTRVYRIKQGFQFKCGDKKNCDKKFNVLKNTIFENSKIALPLWMGAVFLATSHKKGISSHQLSRDLGCTQKTAWFMLHRIRTIGIIKKKQTLKGDNIIIDETFCGGKERFKSKFKRKQVHTGERTIEKTPVLGLMEKEGKAILQVIPEATREAVMPVITNLVEKGSTIITDSSSIYARLKFNPDYNGHIEINHSENEYVKNGYTTNHVESLFACFKRTIYGTYHQISTKHLQAYCNETAYRFNTRKLKDFERFDDTFERIYTRLRYADLIKNV